MVLSQLYQLGKYSLIFVIISTGVNFTYTYELPPRQRGGSFIYSASNIEAVCDHTTNMITGMAKHLVEKEGFGYGEMTLDSKDNLGKSP